MLKQFNKICDLSNPQRIVSDLYGPYISTYCMKIRKGNEVTSQYYYKIIDYML